MTEKRRILIIGLACFFAAASPLMAESISIKFSYNTASINKGDLNTWIESYNSLWNDFQLANGGNLDGQLNTLRYGPKYEVELRIPIFWRIALNISGAHFNKATEGEISYQSASNNFAEDFYVRNEIRAFPFKFGFSYFHPLPFLDNLYVFANVGRHIAFMRYKVSEDLEQFFKEPEEEFRYWYKKDNTFNSEAIGYYLDIGLEYDIIDYLAVVIEAEKIWSKADGFRGPHSFKGEHGLLEAEIEGDANKDLDIYFEENDKASLYYYETDKFGLDKHYSILTGHKKRPEGSDIQNLRQGEFDLSTFSFKIGFRFKF